MINATDLIGEKEGRNARGVRTLTRARGCSRGTFRTGRSLGTADSKVRTKIVVFIMLLVPFTYFGGKVAVAESIASIFPAHRRYVEVFGGAASVLFRKSPSREEVYNDLHDDLANYFLVLREHPEELARRCREIPFSRRIYQRWTREEKLGLLITDVERAARFWFLQAACFSGVHGGGISGHSNSLAWPKKIRRIGELTERLQGVVIESLDFEKLCLRYDAPDTVFYFDPPYLGHGKYFGRPWKTDEWRRLFGVLEQLRGRWLLSEYDNEHARKLARGRTTFVRTIVVSSRANTGRYRNSPKPRRRELLICSFRTKCPQGWDPLKK